MLHWRQEVSRVSRAVAQGGEATGRRRTESHAAHEFASGDALPAPDMPSLRVSLWRGVEARHRYDLNIRSLLLRRRSCEPYVKKSAAHLTEDGVLLLGRPSLLCVRNTLFHLKLFNCPSHPIEMCVVRVRR